MEAAEAGARAGAVSRSAVMLKALRNRRLLRVQVAYLLFNIVEWASWIAILVWAYDAGGVRAASALAVAQLVPSALLASPAKGAPILAAKDAFYDVLSPAEYDYRVSGLQHETFRAIHPTCARKLVEGAEAYARDLGFTPHPDYQRARQIFGDLDATACPTHYVFGRDGKPCFMSGPYDTPARCRRIIDTLTRRCGSEGFHFVVAGEAPVEL